MVYYIFDKFAMFHSNIHETINLVSLRQRPKVISKLCYRKWTLLLWSEWSPSITVSLFYEFWNGHLRFVYFYFGLVQRILNGIFISATEDGFVFFVFCCIWQFSLLLLSACFILTHCLTQGLNSWLTENTIKSVGIILIILHTHRCNVQYKIPVKMIWFLWSFSQTPECF